MIDLIKHWWEHERAIILIVTGVVAMIVAVIWMVIAMESARLDRIADCLMDASQRYSKLEQTGEMMIAFETARNGCYAANKAPDVNTTSVTVIR